MKDSDAEWRIVGVLPNLTVGGDPSGRPFSVEAASMILAGASDGRYRSAAAAEPVMTAFLASFHDEFGNRLEPAAILHHSSRRLPVLEAVAAFRDLIVAAAAPLARARSLAHDGSGLPGPAFSECFDLYPGMPGGDGRSLIVHSPATLSRARLEGFRGQSAVGVPIAQFWQAHVDVPLLKALIGEWNAEWQRRSHSSRNTRRARLFRSLQMASRASRMPAIADMSEYDLGRSVALWISAFEILAHPGGRPVTTRDVLALFDLVDWKEPLLRRRLYQGPKGGRRERASAWIYRHLLAARNTFLHGNPIGRRDTYFRNGQPIARFAAPLYRMALSGFLELETPEGPPESVVDIEMSRRLVAALEFHDCQESFEEALLKAAGRSG